jgi:replicative DNA helicase
MKTIESEWAVIGGIMHTPSKLPDLDLMPEDFAGENHRLIFDGMLELERAGEVIDIITLSELLESRSRRGWLSIIGNIQKNTPGSSNIKTYAEFVKADAQKRRAREIAIELQRTIDNPESVDIAIRELMQINTTRKDHTATIKQALTDAVDDLDKRYNGGGMGISSGLKDLDECLGGFHETDLYIVAARPAMGKTAFMLNLANMCNVPCGVISGEQGRSQVGGRFISINGQVSVHRMRTGKVEDDDWPKITKAVGVTVEKPIYIYDKPGPTILEVIREARKLKYQHDIKILFVDYVQRIKASNKNVPKHEQVDEVVSSLKDIARELQIPVVALAQVNRKVEERTNKRPTMSDIKDSGAIEQEADNVMTLYRDEVYNSDTEWRGVVEIAVMKNRHGPLGVIKADWKGEFMTFGNWTNVRYGHR